MAAGMTVLAAPVKALPVQLSPEKPRLGDTISVLVQTDTPNIKPTVSMRQKNYPVFATSPHRYRALLPTSPLDPSGRLAGRLEITINGDEQTSHLAVWLQDRSFPTQRIWSRQSSSATQLELDRVDAFKKILSPQKFWQGPFLRPNAGRVYTEFGVRRYYNGVFAQDYYHRGVDYAGGQGSPVVAPAAGQVKLIGLESEGFRVHGNTVGIDHGQGVVSIFLHLSRIDVREGDFVKAGQLLGGIGSTGASTGPHLHWGLYVHEVAVDPAFWRYQGVD